MTKKAKEKWGWIVAGDVVPDDTNGPFPSREGAIEDAQEYCRKHYDLVMEYDTVTILVGTMFEPNIIDHLPLIEDLVYQVSEDFCESHYSSHVVGFPFRTKGGNVKADAAFRKALVKWAKDHIQTKTCLDLEKAEEVELHGIESEAAEFAKVEQGKDDQGKTCYYIMVHFTDAVTGPVFFSKNKRVAEKRAKLITANIKEWSTGSNTGTSR